MKPDISDLSVEDLKRLQAEAEALIASKKIKQLKMLIIKLLRLLKTLDTALKSFWSLVSKNVRKQPVKLLSRVTVIKIMQKKLGQVAVSSHVG